MGKLSKRLISIVTSVVIASGLLFSSIAPISASAATVVDSAQSTQVEAVSATQAASIQDGVMLHAWSWSFNSIKENMADIAAAGYTTVQTSPAQACLEGPNGTNPTLVNTNANPTWYYHYQPTFFTLGNYQLGTAAQFKEMCDVAHQYGVKIVVDVVANHLSDVSAKVDQELYNDRHQTPRVKDWSNRTQVTQYHMLELPDINTANAAAQEKIGNYLVTLANAGADGFRFDAAKSIELPTESNGAPTSQFWPTVLNKAKAAKSNLFVYGEVLQGDEPGTNFPGYAKIMNVTGSTYGWFVRSAVGLETWEYETTDGTHLLGGNGSNGKVTPTINAGLTSNYMEGQVKDGSIPNSKLVTFVETHDTYANLGPSRGLSQTKIQLAWAMVAARQGSVPLFFNRPTSQSFGDNYLSPQGEAYKNVGQKGSDDFKQPDVVAINLFHNAMAAEGETVSAENNNNVMKIQRGNKGLVLVNVGGSTSVSISTSLPDGSYVNKASAGGTFTVSGGKVTGNMNGSSMVILYQDNTTPVTTPAVTISQAGGDFKDSLALTLGYTNATSGTYSIDGGAAKAFTNGQSVTIGSSIAVGGTVTVTVNAIGATSTTTKTYTFTKKDTPIIVVPVSDGDAFFRKPAGWGTPKIYVYDDSVTPAKTVGAWPGVAMTDLGDGLFSYKLPTGWTKAKVIFGDGSSQIPGAQQAGYALTAGTPMIYENGAWSAYPVGPVQLAVSELTADKVSPQTIGTEVTFTAKASGGSGTKTTKYTVSNGTTIVTLGSDAKWTPSVIGTYTVTATVTDSTGAIATKIISYVATKGDGKLPLIESISNSKSGSNITYTVNASGGESVGTGLLFYKFYIKNTDGTYSIGQNYSLSNTFTTTSTSIKVEVQNSNNDAVSKLYDYKIIEGVSIDSFKSDKVSPQIIGNTIKLTAAATGGTGTKQYQFSVKSGTTTTIIKSYSTSTSISWTPSVIGNYTLIVSVKDDSNTPVTSQLSYTINKEPTTKVTFKTNIQSPQVAGTPITLSVTGGTETYKYRFCVNDGTKLTVLQDFATSNSKTWTPTKAGTYTISAGISNGTNVTYQKFTYVITAPPVVGPKITSFKPNLVSPQKTGSAIQLWANGTGTGTLKYRFCVNDGTTLKVLKDFGTTRYTTWKPTKAGTYTVSVGVKDSTGKAVYTKFTYVVSAGVTISSFTSNVASPQNVGTSIILKGTATGGSGALQCKFVVNDGTKDTIIKDYSSQGYAIWKPTKAGTYTAYIYVKDAAGTIVKKSFQYVVKSTVQQLAITSFKSSVVSPQSVNKAITLSTIAVGTGTLKYRFCVNDGTTLKVLQDFGTASTISWIPTKAGTYTVSVGVSDSNNKPIYSKFTYVIK